MICPKTCLGLVALLFAAATTVAEEQYLYRAEFDDGRAPGWDLKKTSRWTFEDGVLVQENLTGPYTALYRIAHVSWTDFEVRMRVKFLQQRLVPDRSDFFRVKVRGVDIDLIPGRMSIWWRPAGAERSKAVHRHDRSLTIDPGRWYELSVEYHPSLVTLRCDGQFVAELKDPPPCEGDPITIYFGNMKVALDYFRVVDKEQ